MADVAKIDVRKLDLIEKARGIFTAEGYEIRCVGLAIDIMRNGRQFAHIWSDSPNTLAVGVTSGVWSGVHRDRTIKHALLLIKDAMEEAEA